MQVAQLMTKPSLRPPRGQARLVQIYQQFCDRMTAMHDAGLSVPRSKSRKDLFLKEVSKQAYDCMLNNMRPANQSISAMLSFLVPDLIFARIDHVSPEQLIYSMKPSILVAWDTITEQLQKRPTQHYGLPLSVALEILELRMRAELRQHRPLSEFFVERRYAI